MWLGVCEKRPYLDKYYQPAEWRKRTDFGTATFGDMGCHIFDPVFGALKLTAPISVRSEGPAPAKHNWAINAVIHYVFPETPYTEEKTVKHHLVRRRRTAAQGKFRRWLDPKPIPGQGSIFVGTKGETCYCRTSASRCCFLRISSRTISMPKIESVSHYHEFVESVLGNRKDLHIRSTTPVH